MKFYLMSGIFIGTFICTNAISQNSYEEMDAHMLLKMCETTEMENDTSTSPEKLINASYCMGMIAGAHAIMTTNCYLKDEGYKPMPLLTAGPAPSVEAVLQGFKNFMQENPRDWDQPAPQVLAASIALAFPCER